MWARVPKVMEETLVIPELGMVAEYWGGVLHELY